MEFVQPEICNVVLQSIDFLIKTGNLNLGSIDDDLELVSGELFFSNGTSDSSKKL